MDIDCIPLGVEFPERIDASVGQCNVLLAVIGSKWAGETNANRRIDDPRDFVRIEIESALQRDIPVIPVLVDNASIPTEADCSGVPPLYTPLSTFVAFVAFCSNLLFKPCSLRAVSALTSRQRACLSCPSVRFNARVGTGTEDACLGINGDGRVRT